MKKLTQELVKELLDYNPTTGIFIWKKRNNKWFDSRFAGKRAGTILKIGYEMIIVMRQRMLSHRLAWLWYYGEYPKFTIDHLDKNPMNNSIKNLRDVPQSVNNFNRNVKTGKSGITGIHQTTDGIWEASYTSSQFRYRFGRFKTVEEAKIAYDYGINHLDESICYSKNKKKKTTEKISHEELLSLVKYNPETGEFFKNGKIFGAYEKNGYYRVSINGKRYQAHVLAIFYMTKKWPDKNNVVDHINGDTSDCRYSNIREISKSMNALNRKSNDGKLRGIRRKKGYKNWETTITIDNKRIHIGMFKTEEEANFAWNDYIDKNNLRQYIRD